MIIEYLQKIKKELSEYASTLREQIKSCDNHMKESIKIIQMMEKTDDPNQEAFSPRNSESFNHRKLLELKEQQKYELEKFNRLNDHLEEVKFRLADVSSVLKVAENTFEEYIWRDDNSQYSTRINVLNTVEEERQRIARDLHDTTVQNLTALVHQTEYCTKILESDPIQCKLVLYSIGKTLRATIEDMRKLIYDLRPMSFDDIGFDVTVEQCLDKIVHCHNISCHYDVSGKKFSMNQIFQITLLRVIQEASNNAVTHGHATDISVHLQYGENFIILTIEDNGSGFDPEQIPTYSKSDNSGFGLSMMKERVYLLSGSLSIQSSPGEGCIITATIPKSKED